MIYDRGIVAAGLSLALAACASIHSSHSAINGASVAAKPDTCAIEVYEGVLPGRPYVVVSQLNVSIEKTHFRGSHLSQVIPELSKQACRSGADAIIQIRERRDFHLESRIYSVRAQGIRFTDGG